MTNFLNNFKKFKWKLAKAQGDLNHFQGVCVCGLEILEELLFDNKSFTCVDYDKFLK